MSVGSPHRDPRPLPEPKTSFAKPAYLPVLNFENPKKRLTRQDLLPGQSGSGMSFNEILTKF
jgi:hypothetical protein